MRLGDSVLCVGKFDSDKYTVKKAAISAVIETVQDLKTGKILDDNKSNFYYKVVFVDDFAETIVGNASHEAVVTEDDIFYTDETANNCCEERNQELKNQQLEAEEERKKLALKTVEELKERSSYVWTNTDNIEKALALYILSGVIQVDFKQNIYADIIGDTFVTKTNMFPVDQDIIKNS